MPSKTSFFNKGVFFNNIKRFWLITFSYAFFLFLYIMGYVNSISRQLEYSSVDIRNLSADIFSSSREFMVIFLGFYSLIAALAVFSYMHFPKSTAMVHSLPLRRETLFVTNYLSGLFIVAVPLLLNTAILVIAEAVMDIPFLNNTFMWLIVNLVLTFLLYTFAVFAGMFTGHLAAQAFYYLIFNFLAYFLQTIFNFILRNLLFGFYETGERFFALSPLLNINDIFRNFWNGEGDWLLIAEYFIAGLIFLVSSFFLYRKRHMETATDVVSIRVVKPIFKYSATFCSSALLGSIMVSIFELNQSLAGFIITYLIGGLIGYFVCEMLLRKSFRVLNAYKGFLVYAVILILMFFAIGMDLFGYTGYVPQDSDVDIVSVRHYDDIRLRLALRPELYDPDDHRYILVDDPDDPEAKNPPRVLDDEHIRKLRMEPGISESREAITKARLIHKYIIENKDLFIQNRRAMDNSRDYEGVECQTRRLYISYRLKNGDIIQRNFFLVTYNGNTELDNLLRDYLKVPEVMEKYEPLLNAGPEDIRSVNVNVYAPDRQNETKRIDDCKELLEAYKEDVRASDPLNLMYGSNKGNINIELYIKMLDDRKPYITRSYYYRELTADHKKTIGVLKDKGILDPDLIEDLMNGSDALKIYK